MRLWAPMQTLPTQGQWWSISSTHSPHMRQWWQRSGFGTPAKSLGGRGMPSANRCGGGGGGTAIPTSAYISTSA